MSPLTARRPSTPLAVAVLVFLARAAGAGSVAVDLGGAAAIGHRRRPCGLRLRSRRQRRLLLADLDMRQQGGDLVTQTRQQILEHLEGFFLVFVQWIALAI